MSDKFNKNPSNTLRSQFNTFEKGTQDLANKLQAVLNDLPQKISDMPRQYPGKDIIHILVPVEDGVLSDKAPCSERPLRQRPAQKMMTEITETAFAFLQDLTAKFPSVDCFFDSKCTMWGDFVGIHIITDRKSPLVIAQENGMNYATGEKYFQDIVNILDQESFKESIELADLASTNTFMCIAVRAKGLEPNDIPVIKMEYIDGTQIKDDIHVQQRTWFWNKWAKPAETAPISKPANPHN